MGVRQRVDAVTGNTADKWGGCDGEGGGETRYSEMDGVDN